MPKPLHESTRLVEVDAGDTSAPNRRMIQIITPGWGSSGYYSAEVLERAAENKVIPAGTHMYLNHASESERHDRPERDVEKIAAVLVEDATWDGTRLAGPADLIGPHAELIEALAPYIGVSISGLADASAGRFGGQLELPLDWPGPEGRMRRASVLDGALDAVKNKYGTGAVTRAVLVGRDSGFEAPQLPDA